MFQLTVDLHHHLADCQRTGEVCDNGGHAKSQSCCGDQPEARYIFEVAGPLLRPHHQLTCYHCDAKAHNSLTIIWLGDPR